MTMAIKISGTTVIDDSRNVTDVGQVTIGTGQPFWGNKLNVTSNTTLANTYNHMSIGPITVDDAITVTVETDARWVII
jgi:hypothetical protein